MSTPASRPESPPAPAPPSCRGTHLICELYGASHLTDVNHVASALEAAARACGATHLDTRLHPFEENGGVTGAVLLAESHVTIHTWPEHDYAAVDVFLCGDCDPEAALPVLEEAFGPETMEHCTMERGQPATEGA
jgi:S-adenosylmethionine decarboxylase